MPGAMTLVGEGFIPGIAAGCEAAGAPTGAAAIGLPGIGAAIGRPARVWLCVARAVPGVIGAWRLELSEMNVAQPSTSAIAPPAASPRLSRRVLRPATIGKALVLASTSAFSLISRRGSVWGTVAGSAERTGSSQGPRTVLVVVSMVARLVFIVGIRQRSEEHTS